MESQRATQLPPRPPVGVHCQPDCATPARAQAHLFNWTLSFSILCSNTFSSLQSPSKGERRQRAHLDIGARNEADALAVLPTDKNPLAFVLPQLEYLALDDRDLLLILELAVVRARGRVVVQRMDDLERRWRGQVRRRDEANARVRLARLEFNFVPSAGRREECVSLRRALLLNGRDRGAGRGYPLPVRLELISGRARSARRCGLRWAAL